MTRSAQNFSGGDTSSGSKKTDLLEASKQEIEITSLIKKDIDRTLPELSLF